MTKNFYMQGKSFSIKLKSLAGIVTKLKPLAHELAMSSLAQINIHGNTNQINELFDTMSGAVARDGLVRWAVAHGMVKFEKGKFHFSKRKDVSATPELFLENADKTPFWEFSAAAAPADLKPYDLLESLNRMLKNAKLAAAGESKTHRGVDHFDLLEQLEVVLKSAVVPEQNKSDDLLAKEVAASVRARKSSPATKPQELKAA